MLGWVAAVSATESPSQLRPALIHSTWMSVSSAFTAAGVGMRATFPDLDLRRSMLLGPTIGLLLQLPRLNIRAANCVKQSRLPRSRAGTCVRSQAYQASRPSPDLTDRGMISDVRVERCGRSR